MASSTDDRTSIAWLHRRVGFGLAPGELEELAVLGVDAVLDRLVDPDAHGVAPAADPWDGLDLSLDLDGKGTQEDRIRPIAAWVAAMARTHRPTEEWMRWFWHGHFVSTIRVVKSPQLMVRQLRLLGTAGLGDFSSLLRAVTIDPAMLVYLDGRTNRKGAVNENYGREVLELFALGIGNYGEDDVRAGAEALTGWRIDRDTGDVQYVAKAHDDRSHAYLGAQGVHDLDGVVAAIVGHEACAPFIAAKLCRAILGPEVDGGLVRRLAADFRDDGMRVRPLVRSILEAGLDGAAQPMVWAPLPWFVAMVRAHGLDPARVVEPARRQLVAAGQVPMDAPNVAGWPDGRAWLTSATTLARCTLASGIAELAGPDSPPVRAAMASDWGALASALGRPEGFAAPTLAALGSLPEGAPGARSALTVAMASPDLVVA